MQNWRKENDFKYFCDANKKERETKMQHANECYNNLILVIAINPLGNFSTTTTTTANAMVTR